MIGPDGSVTSIVKGVAHITDEVLSRQAASRVGEQIGAAVSEFAGATQEISETVLRAAALAGQTEPGVAGATAHIEALQVEIHEADASVEATAVSIVEVSAMTGTAGAAVQDQSTLMGSLDQAATELWMLSR